MSKAEHATVQLRREGVGKTTQKHYCASLKQFSVWVCRKHGWTDPVKWLSLPKGDDDIRKRRIALTTEELLRLFDAAVCRGPEMFRRRSPKAKPKTLARLERLGIERAMIYKLGALAGLRPYEIKTLIAQTSTGGLEYLKLTTCCRGMKAGVPAAVPVRVCPLRPALSKALDMP